MPVKSLHIVKCVFGCKTEFLMFYAHTQPYFSLSEVAVPVAGRGSSALLSMNGIHGVVSSFPRLGCTVKPVLADRSPRVFRMEWRGSGFPSFCANAMPVEFMSRS